MPLQDGEFYHYGTSRELISSTVAVQNLVNDQRAIINRKIKPHPAMFVQNAEVKYKLSAENSEVWIENSYVNENWLLSNRNIITGVPVNDWVLSLPSGVCVDVVPYQETDYIARPYGFNDAFKGDVLAETTLFMGRPVKEWMQERRLDAALLEHTNDLQSARLFPVCHSVDDLGKVLRWMNK